MASVVQYAKILILALALSLGASFVYAWTGPTATAPDGNISSPINVSGTDQVKSGGLWLGSLGTDGGASIGTTISAGTTISSPQYCIGTSCITTWPSGSTSQWGTAGSAIYYNGGNVGIGTASPVYKLDVNGSLNVTGSIYGTGYDNMPTFGGGGNGWYGAGTSNASGGATPVSGYYPYAINNHTGLAFSAHTAYGGIRFYNQPYPTAPMSATPAMQITNNNVSVANTLSVGGTIYASGNVYANGNSTYGLYYNSGVFDTINTGSSGDPLELNYYTPGDIRFTGGDLTMNSGYYVYPGSYSGLGAFQKSYYLASHSQWGLYSNTSLNAQGLYDSGNRVYSAVNPPSSVTNATNATYGRYVYNNGAYNGSGWVEASSLGVYYSYLGRLVYNNGAYSGSGWVEPSDLGVRYASSAGSASSATNATNATYGRYVYNNGAYSGSGWVEASSLGVYYAYYGRLVYNNGAYSGSGWVEPSDLGVRYARDSYYATYAGYASSAGYATSAGNVGLGALYSCPMGGSVYIGNGVYGPSGCQGQLQKYYAYCQWNPSTTVACTYIGSY